MLRWGLFLTIFIALGGTAHARTFEQQLKKADQVKRLSRVIGPFLQTCGQSGSVRDIQCRAIRSRMQHRVKQGTFVSVVPAVRIGTYDNTRLNFPLSVLGCVTCDGPAKLDKSLYGGKKWYVTTAAPKRAIKLKDGKPDFAGLELKRLTQAVGPAQVENWMRTVLPNLKVQLIYQVRGKRWPGRLGNGLAVELQGYRLFNQCSGKVLFSSPASTGVGPRNPSATCGGTRVVIRRERPRRRTIPTRLSPAAIRAGMTRISSLVQACYDQYQVPGLAEVIVTVVSTGKVKHVKVLGKFKGSPTTGKCLISAVKRARFTVFKNLKMVFRYRWHLR